jgi:lipoprotein-releasing system permease protein
MYRPLELFVGLRYLRSKHANRYVSFISLASVLGVGLGVGALIVVISVMNGLGDGLRDRLLGLNAHVTVRAAEGTLGDWQQVQAQARAQPGVLGAAPFVDGEGMLVNGPNLSAVQIQGVLPAEEPAVSEIARSSRKARSKASSRGRITSSSAPCWRSSRACASATASTCSSRVCRAGACCRTSSATR